MRGGINYFFLDVDQNTNRTIKLGDLELYYDPEYRPLENAIQVGKIGALPSKVHESYRYDVDLKVGDTVYFHHFIVQKNNEIYYENLYGANYSQIYCAIKDGNIQMLEDFILVKPIKEDESKLERKVGSIIIQAKLKVEDIKQHGIVHHVPKQAAEKGIKQGDHIVFDKACEYPLTVEGELFYRMKLGNILLRIEDDKPIPCGTQVLCESIPEVELVSPSGIILSAPTSTPKRFQLANVIASADGMQNKIEPGSTIMFLNGAQLEIELQEKKYLLIREEVVLATSE